LERHRLSDHQSWNRALVFHSPLSRRATISREENPLWLRWLLSWAQAHGKRFYNFDGLDAFKTKFQRSAPHGESASAPAGPVYQC